MDRTRPTLNQLNIVSANVDASIAFYRRLRGDVPERRTWRTGVSAREEVDRVHREMTRAG